MAATSHRTRMRSHYSSASLISGRRCPVSRARGAPVNRTGIALWTTTSSDRRPFVLATSPEFRNIATETAVQSANKTQDAQGPLWPTRKAWRGISAIACRHFIWQQALPLKLSIPRPATHMGLPGKRTVAPSPSPHNGSASHSQTNIYTGGIGDDRA